MNRSIAVLLLVYLLPTVSSASPIAIYQLDVTFDLCLGGSIESPECAPDDEVTTDQVYGGYFGFGGSYLDTDGFVDASLALFYMQIGSTVWNLSAPDPESDLRGVRYWNPATGYGDDVPVPEGDAIWTLLIQDGQLEGICCGVYGGADFPFIDLYTWQTHPGGLGPWYAGSCGYSVGDQTDPNLESYCAQGAFSFHRVAEPRSIALLVAGLAGIWLVRRRRQVCFRISC